MPTNNNENRVHLKHAVVAVCDNQNGTAATNRLQLGNSFMFNAQYEPPGAVLFWLSVSLTKETTLYVRFKPSVISSLKRFACNNPTKRPPMFDTIQGHLDGHRSFTRLEFELRNYGELVPIGFDLEDYEDQVHRFESINSLATTLNFSLYMPLDTFRKPDHQFFYRFINPPSDPPEEQNAALLRITNLLDLYQGKGGELFHSVSQDGQPPPCYDLLPPPKYKIAEGHSRTSQHTTASELESDISTVAAIYSIGLSGR
jgi:hypothetical protein